MNGTDSQAVAYRSALVARLQATLPLTAAAHNAAGPATSGSRQPALDSAGRPPETRLQHTTFKSLPREASTPLPAFPPETQTVWLFSALDALSLNRRLIAGLALTGFVMGYFYSKQICVPLYRIQASIELQTEAPGTYTETVARILKSQSFLNAALSSLPESERTGLLEPNRLAFFNTTGFNERLGNCLSAVAIPSAQIVDLSLISPDRQAATDFVNALIQRLIQRDREQLRHPQNTEPERSIQKIAIIDPALATPDPISPNTFLNLFLGLLLGTTTGCAYALFSKFAANTFVGPGSVGQVLGVRELGTIPERKLLTAAGHDMAATALDCTDESLRYLRSSLLYQPGKQQVRCLAFTSAAPGEGKTTVVSNLSMSLAATGRRVLVIDGDLRRPRLHKLLQVPPGPGLADLLRRDPFGPPAALSRYVAPTSFQNLYVLPPGTAGNDAPELLAGKNLPQLLGELRTSFDFVLIDTPPLLACADARNYSRAAEGVVLIVRASETQKRAALVARDMILQDGANIIGTVLTAWRQTYPSYSCPTAANYLKPK